MTRRRFSSWTREAAALTCALAAVTGLMTQAPQAMAATVSTDAKPADTGRVIVKWKRGSALLSQMASQAMASQRAQALGHRVGMNLQSGLSISDTLQVMTASGTNSKALAAKLSSDPNVEFAVEDQRRFRMAVPNDRLYGANPSPASSSENPLAAGQWYLRAPTAETPAAINAPPAWDITTGSSNVVVAVLDSGVRYDHPDLTANLLPGYDMITNVATANDGDGRDADASDPGDWVTSTEAFTNGGPFAGCTVEDSSWHGTQTASLIAAVTDNTIGMASVARNVKVLPVRVLGKCGGYDSDIVAGMRWAVGLQVGTLPINPHPAKILNLSLGSSGTCGTNSAYPSAIADVVATGALIVASAGNSAGHSVSTPANCSGVVAVGGLRHVGTKVGYSDVGPEITLSAPAGNCVTSSGACQYPIVAATNSGATTPVAANEVYTNGGNDASLGTSFSAPLVSATAALMWSARPGLSAAEIKSKLIASARAFPTTGGSSASTPACHPSNGTDQLECYCTTTTCGAGMLDVGAATALAANGLYARIVANPATGVAGQAITLDASSSLLPANHTIASYAWSISNGGGIVTAFSASTNAATTSITPSGNGSFTVALTITDNTGLTSTTSQTITVGSVTASSGGTTSTGSSVAGTDGGGGGGGAVDARWLALLSLAIVLMAAVKRRAARR